jgi:hypothetical protein
MSNRKRGAGRPFIAAVTLGLGEDTSHLQSGQWVRRPGQAHLVRFVRERETNKTFIVPRPVGGKVSMAAFRLACGVENPQVITPVV